MIRTLLVHVHCIQPLVPFDCVSQIDVLQLASDALYISLACCGTCLPSDVFTPHFSPLS